MRLAPAVVAALLAHALAPDATACSYGFAVPDVLSYGIDGAPIGAQVVLLGHPGTGVHAAELWSQPPGRSETTGEQIRVTREVYATGRRGELLAVLTPERRFGIDETISVFVNDFSFGERPVEAAAFVGGQREAPPAPPAPTGVTWYHDRLDARVPDSCGQFREVANLTVETVPHPNLRWLRVTFRDASGETADFALRPIGDLPAGGQLFIDGLDDVTCVEVRAVGIDGAESAPLETCRPDKCTLSPGAGSAFPYVGPTWDEIAPGCNLDCAPNAEEGFDCSEGAWPADAPRDDGSGLAADAGGCDATGSSASALALLGVALAWRRRR